MYKIMYRLVPYAFVLVLYYSDAYLQETKGEKRQIQNVPTDYRPGKLSSINSVTFNPEANLLVIFTSAHLSEPTAKFSFMYSIVEIYDTKMTLLHRFEKTAKDTNKVIQNIRITTIESDSILVRSWGFVYHIMQDKETSYDSKKVGFATTELFQKSFPRNNFQKKSDSTIK